MTDEHLKIYLTRIMEAMKDHLNISTLELEQIVKSTINEIYQIGFAEGKESVEDELWVSSDPEKDYD